MQRVLSFQVGDVGTRGFGESSEFVTKRMCFSFIFFFGFLSLIGGFLLGRFTSERTAKLREDRKRFADMQADMPGELDSLRQPEQLLLEQLDKISVDQSCVTELSRCRIVAENIKKDGDDAHHENVRSILSNYHTFDKIVDKKSSIVATIYGTCEPDRWVVLSVSGDGVVPALELAGIFAKLIANRKWKPQRTIVFQFFEEGQHSCCNGLSKYLKARIVACLAIHGNAIRKNGCLTASGSEVVTSSVLEAFDTAWESTPVKNQGVRQIFEPCKYLEKKEKDNALVMLPVDVPHAFVTFLSVQTMRNASTVDAEMESQFYRRTLIRIIGLAIWRFSENQTLHWDPKYFEQSVNENLKMIKPSQFVEIKEKISTTVKKLIVEARSLLGHRDENSLEKRNSLSSRMKNDLVMNLDRALLCQDVDTHLKTDLASFPTLLSKSPDMLMGYLDNLLKCYEEALEILKEG